MHYYGCYDPLQYPLLRPYGDSGWHHGFKKMSQGSRTQVDVPEQPITSEGVTDVNTFLDAESASKFDYFSLFVLHWS